MKQYCRYCIHCHTGNGNWCDAKQKEYSDSTFKAVNKCKQFDFCEIDAFGENKNPYHPRPDVIDEGEAEYQMHMDIYG